VSAIRGILQILRGTIPLDRLTPVSDESFDIENRKLFGVKFPEGVGSTGALPKGYLEWQKGVLSKDVSEPPSSPTIGDRYLLLNPSGGWSGHTNQIAEYDGSSWIFFTPSEGWITRVIDIKEFWIFSSNSWSKFESSVNHNDLEGLQGGASGEYYHLTQSEYQELVALLGLLTITNSTISFNAGIEISNTSTGIVFHKGSFDYSVSTSGTSGWSEWFVGKSPVSIVDNINHLANLKTDIIRGSNPGDLNTQFDFYVDEVEQRLFIKIGNNLYYTDLILYE